MVTRASPKPHPPPAYPPVALCHLSLAGHTWILQGDVNLGSNDVVALLQGMGCHRCPLTAGVNEQDVSLTDTLGILPWEAKDGRRKKGKANIRRGRDTDGRGTALPDPVQVNNAQGIGSLPAVASGL